jgi:hypothetical protein
MRSLISTSTLAFLGLSALTVSAAPTRQPPSFPGGKVFPLPDGFPTPNDAQIKQIEQKAFGTLPNAPPPGTISADGLTNLKLIALNELFEVAFFTELISNVTNYVPGFEIASRKERNFVLATLNAVVNQEKLHALNANGALEHFGADPILPCKYSFPVKTFDEAIALAGTFTSVVLGTLQDVTQIFAQNGDAALTRGIASVIGQEGEQEGWYRLLQGKIPNELPFLTTSVRDFAFTAIQSFTVPGSCPNINTIPLKTFLPLNLLTTPKAKTQNIKFSWEKPANAAPGSKLFATYINQQNLPVTEPLQMESVNGNTVIAEALFPYDKFEMNGLTILALTNSKGPFPDADAVAAATVFGPGLIIIN